MYVSLTVGRIIMAVYILFIFVMAVIGWKES